ncbi:hypothetical protein FHS21_003696 [Phyllobacterium trifolii]|uniref:Uncharacterized protein n=1 Tax=Phyllobacterium trifolii TaxID=300193 RepID=A0A839UEJ8_9HYPH|nr:hypothetical protein [Phyllobacterium trifolii]
MFPDSVNVDCFNQINFVGAFQVVFNRTYPRAISDHRVVLALAWRHQSSGWLTNKTLL